MSLFLCALYTTGDDYKIKMKSSHIKSYRNAMYYNRHMFWDKVVLDVSCDTGILSMQLKLVQNMCML